MRRKDGTSFPVEYTHTPLEEDGEVVGAVVVFRDITERRQAEATIQSFARLTGEAPYPVVQAAADGKIMLHNRASADLLAASGDAGDQRVPTVWQSAMAQALAADQIVVQECTVGERSYTCHFPRSQRAAT